MPQTSEDPLTNEPPPPVAHQEIWLEVAQHEPALVWLPETSERPQPLAVITHGAGGTAAAHCRAWRRQLGPRGFLLCLAGRRISNVPGSDAGYFYPDHYALEAELLAALSALTTYFGDDVDAQRALYAGYSQGAEMGAHMIFKHAPRIARIALIEGGGSGWNVARAQQFHDAGGERVLFVCGLARCIDDAKNAAGWLKRGNVDAVAEYAPGAGHTYSGKVAALISERLPWLLEDDERWSFTPRQPSQVHGLSTQGLPSQ